MFKVKFDYVVWENADGVRVTKSGGREMQHAKKLVKKNLATLDEVNRTFLGYGRSRDSGTSAYTYEVTIFNAIPG